MGWRYILRTESVWREQGNMTRDIAREDRAASWSWANQSLGMLGKGVTSFDGKFWKITPVSMLRIECRKPREETRVMRGGCNKNQGRRWSWPGLDCWEKKWRDSKIGILEADSVHLHSALSQIKWGCRYKVLTVLWCIYCLLYNHDFSIMGDDEGQ